MGVHLFEGPVWGCSVEGHQRENHQFGRLIPDTPEPFPMSHSPILFLPRAVRSSTAAPVYLQSSSGPGAWSPGMAAFSEPEPRLTCQGPRCGTKQIPCEIPEARNPNPAGGN